ncbi:UNVERIFIED_CONTAM: hypothetical protein NCL1_50667 [Trichonephila clavipes]
MFSRNSKESSREEMSSLRTMYYSNSTNTSMNLAHLLPSETLFIEPKSSWIPLFSTLRKTALSERYWERCWEKILKLDLTVKVVLASDVPMIIVFINVLTVMELTTVAISLTKLVATKWV